MSNNKKQVTNKTAIKVDINGVVLSTEVKSVSIRFREICDYFNKDFPVRIMEVDSPLTETFKILNTKTKLYNDRPMYDVNILSLPVKTTGAQNKSMSDGQFKAILRDNDSSNLFTEVYNMESRLYAREQGEMKNKLVFYLFRENELRFNLGGKINFVTGNSTLSNLVLLGATLSNPDLHLCFSKFDANPQTGMFIVPPISYTDYIDLLDKEFGLYKTKYMSFVEHNVYFLLNRDNDINLNSKSMMYTLVLDVARGADISTDRYVRKLNDKTYQLSIEANKVKVYRSNDYFSNSLKYILPNGKVILDDIGVSRNYDTIIKLTNVEPISKLKSPEYEMCEIDIMDASLNFITPVSKFSITDAMGKRRIYRVCYKETDIVSNYVNRMKIKGFRLIDKNN